MPLRLGLALAACLVLAPAQGAELRDANGRVVSVEDASRIVSIGGAVTEILYALGMEERIVGVDTTSTYPAEAGEHPDVGYMRALSAEGVLSLAPSLILAVEGSGPSEVVALLEQASVPLVMVPDAASPEGVLAKIRTVAAAVDAGPAGEDLAAAVADDLAAVRAMADGIDDKARIAFVLSPESGAPLAAGSDTSAEAILNLAGARNALEGFSGFKPVSGEAMVAAAPEAVVTMAERGHQAAGAILESPAFAGTPAAREGRAIAMSGLYLLGFGPRTAHAARELAGLLYPDASLPDLPERPWARPAGS